MHSSRPDCVFGDARLPSSTTTMFAKIGPRRNSKRCSRWLYTLVPTMSAGRRSAVHWMRGDWRAARRQVGRALDAGELAVDAARERPGEGRLADARVVLDEDVALREQRDDHLVED